MSKRFAARLTAKTFAAVMAGFATVGLGTIFSASPSLAQDWPTRPVTMVVPFAAGGPIDVVGRILAKPLSDALGQQVIVDNVTGGGGMTGSYRVSRAAPDGYQFVLGSIGTHALNQLLYKKPLYNAETDFTPVMLIAGSPLVLVVRKDMPVGDLKEFAAYVKERAATMQYGSGGAGTSSHIGCELLNLALGVKVTHVPYRGGAQAMPDLVAGRIDYICNTTSVVFPQIEGGQVKAIAMMSRERSALMPNLATANEQGLKDFDAYTWNAIFFPKDTPAALVAAMNKAASQAIDDPGFQARMKDIGLSETPPGQRSPDYLGRFVASEIAKWAAPIKSSGASEDGDAQSR